MRLIDADALKHHYSWWGTEVGDGTSKYEREVFDSIVDAQPTIEAVPVKHGHWISKTDNPISDVNWHHECSVCGMEYRGYDYYYCPRCGAKMDGEGE